MRSHNPLTSGGRTFDPRTGKEWERISNQPDIASSDEDALTAANAAALARLTATAPDSTRKNALGWTRTTVLARAKPIAISADTLGEYAGDYDVRLVRIENGKLWYQRDATRNREELTPVDNRTFALAEATRVEFIREGACITGMRLTSPLGQVSTFPRTK